MARHTPTVAALTLTLVAGGCAAADQPAAQTSPGVPASTSAPEGAGASQDVRPEPPMRLREGRTADSQRARFVPGLLELPDGVSGRVTPVSTVDGELQIPESGRQVGWWDGGAQVGDPFGHVVLAGHIDDAEGLGVLESLTRIRVGEVLTVRAGDLTEDYEVTDVRLVDKDVLSSDTDAFDQRGEHRLVLITCWGEWRPEVRSYASNLVVFAAPVPEEA